MSLRFGGILAYVPLETSRLSLTRAFSSSLCASSPGNSSRDIEEAATSPNDPPTHADFSTPAPEEQSTTLDVQETDNPDQLPPHEFSRRSRAGRRLRKWLRGPYSNPETSFINGLSQSQAIIRSKNITLLDAEMPKWPTAKATRPLLLTFDAFDTLFTPSLPVPTQYCEIASQWGIHLSEEEVEASFRKAFKKLSKEFPNYGKSKDMPYRTWWNHIIHDTLQPLLPEAQRAAGVPPELVDKLYMRFSSNEGYELFQDVMRFLAVVGTSFQARRWAPRRTMLGVLSNSDPRVREILASYSIGIAPAMFPPRYTPHSRHFKHRFGPATFAFATLSYECGHSKPSRLIFDAATRAAQAALDKLHNVGRLTRSGLHMLDDVRREFHHMHVGDDIDKDILPALNCGWDPVLLDRKQEQEITSREIGGQQVTVINNLMALREVVCKERFEREDGTPRQAPVWIDESRPIHRARYHRLTDLLGRRIVIHPQSPKHSNLHMIE